MFDGLDAESGGGMGYSRAGSTASRQMQSIRLPANGSARPSVRHP